MSACVNHSNLLQRVLEASEKVHGATNTKMTLITVFAENGLVTPLKKLLMVRHFFILYNINNR